MIIHVHQDGSEGYEYEPNDAVIVEKTLCGGWFDSITVGRTDNVVATIEISRNGSWRTAVLRIKNDPNWGTVGCMPWMVKPAEDTYRNAQRKVVQ
jgi:hypothetical protein